MRRSRKGGAGSGGEADGEEGRQPRGYRGRIASDDRLLTDVLLAAEEFTTPEHAAAAGCYAVEHAAPAGSYAVEHAASAKSYAVEQAAAAGSLTAERAANGESCTVEGAATGESLAATDAQRLLRLAQGLMQEMREDPAMTRRLADVPLAFGDGDVLRLLFNNLFPEMLRPRALDPQGLPILSEREVEVLALASGGNTYAEIAASLSLSIHTVRTHMKHVYKALEVNTIPRAVGRAAAMGYLPLAEAFRFVVDTRRHTRGLSTFQEFCAGVGAVDPPLSSPDMRALGSLGLLLIAFSAAASRHIGDGSPPGRPDPGFLWEVNADGACVRVVGADCMGAGRAIIAAPPHAANAGFQPGHLFVVHDAVAQQGLNRAAISEFTSQGQFVRCFAGGIDVATRLIGPLSLAFASSGSLLATSGWLTDGILEFSAGGHRVSRFADGSFTQVAVGHDGRVYACRHLHFSGVSVFDASGRFLHRTGIETEDSLYHGVVVDSQHNVWVRRDTGRVRMVEACGPDGTLLFSRSLPGSHAAILSIDRHDRVYVACHHPPGIRVLGPGGDEVLWISMPEGTKPCAAAMIDDGRLWICGCAAD